MLRINIQRLWQSFGWLNVLLLPLTALFAGLVTLRRSLYKAGINKAYRSPVPVIVVGNITVGGSGKTPLVIWLADHLRQLGYQPGIVSRGYRGTSQTWPLAVTPATSPERSGDEPVMLAQRTGCPVYVAPDRPAAIQALLNNHSCDIIISDDGMQHYAMARDIEIAVIDAERGLGNGWMLPTGPLREPANRLQRVNLCIANGQAASGYTMQLVKPIITSMKNGQGSVELATWRGRTVHAMAGIGYPERFFNLLKKNRLIVKAHPMPDHHDYQAHDFASMQDAPILMTEKDAVKCRQFTLDNAWVVAVQAEPDPAFVEALNRLLDAFLAVSSSNVINNAK